jgi:hypothetical protein
MGYVFRKSSLLRAAQADREDQQQRRRVVLTSTGVFESNSDGLTSARSKFYKLRP